MQWTRAAWEVLPLLALAACGGQAVATTTEAAPATVQAGDPTRSCPPAPQPDRRPTVAVWYFDNGALSDRADYAPLSKGIASMLGISLRSNCRIRVVEREQLQRLVAEQDRPHDRIDPSTRVRIGKLLGAQHMIMGSFVVDPRGRMQINAWSVNSETGEHEASAEHRDDARNLLDMVPVLARRLNEKLDLPPMSSTPVFEGRRPSNRNDELLGLRLFSRAIEEQDRGDRARAIELYRAALAKFPSYAPARQALQRLGAD